MSAFSELLPAGKLPSPLLERLLHRYAPRDPRVVIGPAIGEDAAVLDFRSAALAEGERYLVVKSDPITFATDEIGWYAVNVNANDIAVMGAQPRWFLATVLLPAGRATAELAERIFAQVHDAARRCRSAWWAGTPRSPWGWSVRLSPARCWEKSHPNASWPSPVRRRGMPCSWSSRSPSKERH